MNPSYVESVWWALKQIHSKGLLVEDYRVAPYCPRCGTGLSDHELAQGYETVTDPSVFVRFPLTSGPYAGSADRQGASLLVWTTTPWTLVSNTAVAVHPDVNYVVVGDGNETLVVAEPLFATVLGEGWTVEATVLGKDMERWRYQRPFELVAFPEGSSAQSPEGSSAQSPEEAHFVVLGEYVTTEDGTGLVHQSPAFGQDDMLICKAYGLPVVNPVKPDGHFFDDLPLVGGQFFKHADADLVRDLDARGVLEELSTDQGDVVEEVAVGLNRVHHREAVRLADQHVVLTERGGLVHQSRSVLGGDVLTEYDEVRLTSLREGNELERTLIPPALHVLAQDGRLDGPAFAENRCKQGLCDHESLGAVADHHVVHVWMNCYCRVRHQRPRRRGPHEQARPRAIGRAGVRPGRQREA